jgi:aminomethyltransferase
MVLTDSHTDMPVVGGQPAAPAPTEFGDIAGEFQALRAGCGTYRLPSRAKIRLTGADRVRWLNGMVTNNIRDLAPGQGVYTFLLNPQGHILGDLYAYNRAADVLLDVERAQLDKVLALFDLYIIMDEVEVADVSAQIAAIELAGPRVSEILRSAGLAPAEPLAEMEFCEIAWHDAPLTLVRQHSADTYEIWPAPLHAQELFDELVTHGAKPVGATALELQRIAQGIPRYGQDIRERDLPQETGQAHALHFSKGCYVGQEIVERIRSRGNVHRAFVGFLAEGPLPAPGTKIQIDSKDMGEITSAAVLPLARGEQKVALGYVRREASAPGTVLKANESQVTVASLPFANLD